MLTIMMIGDVVGSPGRKFLKERLPSLMNRHKPDVVIANGENAAGGKGITEAVAREFYDLGVDVITMGNHTWDNRQILDFIGQSPGLIRPANYPPGAPGRGWVIHEIRPGVIPVAVASLMGRTFMASIDCPFQAADRVLAEIQANAPGEKQPALIVDFHAEATSEKETMGFYLAGKAAAVLGTHTHVQTADERILKGGAAYITDVGMTGTRDSVLGVKPEIMIRRFMTQMPVRHELEEGPAILSGVIVRIDEESGKAVGITRVNEYEGV
jgi:metallophosphoesterase (TIGR00282 family)